MRLSKLTLTGISEAFPSPVSVDFEALGPGLVALVGENGAGKSTLIGCVYAALFRQLPGQRRSLYDFCTNPKPEIDLTFCVDGVSSRALHKINPQARQIESYLFDGQGRPLTNGKKEAFEEEIGKRIGTAQLFQATIFSNQKRTGNFLGLERSERKELFITELLGLERLRRISAAAHERADGWGRKILSLEGERRGIDQLIAGAFEIERLEVFAAGLERASADLENAETERQQAEEKLGRLRTQEVERKGIECRRRDLSGRALELRSAIGNLEQQLAEDRGLLARRAGADVTEDIRGIDARIEQLHRQMERAKAVESANREIEDKVRSAEEGLRAKQDELRRSQRESSELRVVPCGGQGWYAACPKIQRAIQARESLTELGQTIAMLQGELEASRGLLLDLPDDLARRMTQLQRAQRERRDLEAIRRQQEERKIAEACYQERQKAVGRLVGETADLERQVQELATTLDRFDGLDTEIGSINRRLQEAAAKIKQRQIERDQLIALQAQAEQRLRQVEAARERSQALEAELQAARAERGDYDYLARVFGPDEIQLCEIQAAGPGVSAIVNDLLEGCFDNKFEVRFRTQRPRADGKGVVDDFDIEVRNKTLDRVCLVDELSGGQFVLVNEAVNLGIAIYNMRQAEGVRHETLFRDETVGALDAKNAKEYVRMLRRAMDVGGFYQVIFICHSPQVWEMADRILFVGGGKVSLENHADPP